MLPAPEVGGAAIRDCLLASAGELVVGGNESIAQIPASTFKTLTSATALELIGPDYQFETKLVSSAEIVDGELDGDLVIVGSGDPMLGLADFEEWVEKLKLAGLTRITGGVVGDASFFPEETVGDYWNWGDVGNGYGSPVAGLNFEHNRFTAGFEPGIEGEAAKFIGTDLEVPGVIWDSAVITGSAGSGDGVMIYGGPGATTMKLRGSVPAGDEIATVSGAVPDPARFAAHQLYVLLRDADIAIGKPASVGVAPVDSRVIHIHKSSTMIEIVRSLHAVSDNHETECLFQLLGVQAKDRPERVIRDHWKARGLDLSDCRIEDGSGLSRADTITPEDLAWLQYLVRRGSRGNEFYESLNAYYDGSVRWKGGAMSAVRSYCGYVTSESGGEYCFALMFNHYPDGGTIAPWRDRLMRSILSL